MSDDYLFKNRFVGWRKVLERRILFCLCCLFISSTLLAEGSRDLYPKSDHQAKRSYLMARGGHGVITTVSAFDPYPSAGVMRVYAKQGERIYTGSSIVGMRAETSSNVWTNRGDIVLISPSGVIHRLSALHNITVGRSSRIGLIENYAEEQVGPVGSGSYTPFTVDVTAGQEGIWEVHFLALGNNGTNIPNPQAASPGNSRTFDGTLEVESSYNFNRNATQDWIQPVYSGNNTRTATSLIAAWDVSIGAAGNHTTLIPGRLYTNSLNLTGRNSVFEERSFYHTFTVMTPSGYTYQVNTNGLNGASFNFFSNNKGIRKTALTTSDPAYTSKDYNAAGFGTAIAPFVWDPRSPDDGLENFTNKIFYNTPASDLPVGLTNIPVFYSDPSDSNPYDGTPSYGTGFGPGQTWLRSTPVTPTLSDAYANCYGLITFKANVARD
jgi:hypothetical protein